MIKVYVAASSKEKLRFGFVKELLAESDILELAHDWVEVQAMVLAFGGASDAELSRHDARRYATEDLSHIETARVFWLLAPETRTSGAWVEFGYALARSRSRMPPRYVDWPQHVVVSGPVESSIFCALAEEHATDLDAFDAITAWGRWPNLGKAVHDREETPSSSEQ